MKVFSGKAVSLKNQKTAIVEVERFYAHPLYEKRVRRTKRYPVHDEIGVKEGDTVRFTETRPISKTKRWKIVEVVGRKKVSEVSSASAEATADKQVSKAKKRENQRKSAQKLAKNQRLGTKRNQR